MKVFRVDSDHFKNLSDTEHSIFIIRASRAVLFKSRDCFEGSVPSVNRSPTRYTFCNAPFHYPVQCEHYLIVMPFALTKWLTQIFLDCSRINKGERNKRHTNKTLTKFIERTLITPTIILTNKTRHQDKV